MTFEINSTYTLISSKFDPIDEYIINPFDKNGFLINQFNIDVRLNEYDGNPIIITLPDVITLQGQYNFVVNITGTYVSYTGLNVSPPPMVYGGSPSDWWNDTAIWNYQTMTWTPISVIDEVSGIYSVTPYNTDPNAQFAMALDAQPTQNTSSMEAYRNLVEQARQQNA